VIFQPSNELALNAETGERIWHFQAVHHDIWDRDFSAPPVPVTVKQDGKIIGAVAQSLFCLIVRMEFRCTRWKPDNIRGATSKEKLQLLSSLFHQAGTLCAPALDGRDADQPLCRGTPVGAGPVPEFSQRGPVCSLSAKQEHNHLSWFLRRVGMGRAGIRSGNRSSPSKKHMFFRKASVLLLIYLLGIGDSREKCPPRACWPL
jgi:hypothetical protein